MSIRLTKRYVFSTFLRKSMINLLMIHFLFMKIIVPKVLKWYSKDFGSDKRKAVRNVVTLYEPTAGDTKDQILLGLKTHTLKIKYSKPRWVFLPMFYTE